MAMEDTRWRQLKGLFFDALEIPIQKRDAWLEQLADPVLRAELMQLLDDDAGRLSVLDVPLGHLAQLVDEEATASHGQRLGPYRLVEELGRGGMGTVYLAERDDGAFQQQVALKVVRQGLATDDLVRRFEQERQILASLNHPHIARLFDGGTTDAGIPYFAMECIDGAPITTYCDARQLSVDERLRLFQGACRAVQYAHQNLIVHRDLKPSNMLVTPEGQLKLLDFGIAKLLASEQADPLKTQTGLRVMTPAYASPEQLRGEAISTATDVYALGVVLYELLTGQRPYDEAPDLQALTSTLPSRPSTAVTETIDGEALSVARSTTIERLHRKLAGDLDTIVLKALRPEPTRRYASAEAFLDDIQRHLDGLPVRARKDTVGYRVRKFVTRHRVGVIAAALGLVVLIGAGLFHSVRVSQERDVARQEAEKAEQVTQFLVDLLQESNPNHAPGGAATVRDVLDEGAERLQKELEDQPALRAHLLETVSEVYYGLGLYDEASKQAEEVVRLQEQHEGAQHLALADALAQVARIRLAQARVEEAAMLSRKALAIRQAVLDSDHPDIAHSLKTLAMAVRMLGQFQEAEAMLRQALGIYRQQPAPNPEVAQTLTSLAHVVRNQDRPAEAEALHREALALRRQIWGASHPYIADALINLAGVLLDQQQYAKAERYFKDGLAMRRATQGKDHAEIGVDLGGLARLYRETGQVDVAIQTHHEAIAHLRRTLGPHHETTLVNLYALSRLLLDRGQVEEAESLLRDALAGRQATHPAGHWLVAEAEGYLGACLTAQGRFAEAESLLTKSYATLLQDRGPDFRTTLEARGYLAALYQQQGQPQLAARYQ